MIENLTTVKLNIISLAGILGAIFSNIYGGWTQGMTTLIIFMAADYFTGLIVAGVFHKSNKSCNGTLESRAGFKGLCKKGVVLIIVLVAVRLDIMLQLDTIKDAVVIGFCFNEGISILENAGLMGLPIPDKLRQALDILQNKAADAAEQTEKY